MHQDREQYLLTPAEAATFLRTNVRTMERWRSMNTGPDFCKVGHRVAYPRVALEAFISQQTSSRAGSAPAAAVQSATSIRRMRCASIAPRAV